MKKFSNILNAYAPPTIWASVIFLFSSQTLLPGLQETPHDFIFKKLAHIFVYFILYLLIKRAIDLTFTDKSTVKNIIFPVLICLLYALADEYHQSLVPGRYATFRDVGYDMLGVGTAFLKKYNYI